MTLNIEMNTENSVTENPAPSTLTFASLDIPEVILTALTRINFLVPTPIQAQAIPLALKGRDILGTAQTGTGKTAAFTIPMLAHLINNPASTALIVAPTRELATQIQQAVILMADRGFGIRSALMIGGDPMSRQMHQLKQNPRIFIGTPGRINDHLKRRTLNLSKTDYLVLDETDRMLDMGFGVQIDQILKFMPQARQTMLFSATLPPYIVKLADKYMNRPERIAVGSTNAPIAKIKQETMKVSSADKYTTLTAELDKRSGSVIIFVKTKHGCDRLAHKLEKEQHSVEAIHGDLRQNKRDRVIKEFRNSKIRILVATDVAARGLDIPHIEHVINYDLPQCPEDFIHRIGRTGRNGAEGTALSFITGEDGAKWNAIQRLLNPGAPRAANEDGQRGRSGNRSGRKPHRKGGGGDRGGFGFKHKRKEWNGPNRHRDDRDGGQRDVRPNEGRYQAGDAPRPQRTENRNETRHEQQPRENRDSWGNRDRSDGKPEGIYKPRQDGYQGKKRFDNRDKPRGDRPFNRDGNRDRKPEGNRPEERSFERPSYGKDGQKPQGQNDRYKGGGNRDRNDRSPRDAGDNRPRHERSPERPSYGGSDSRPAGSGDRFVKRAPRPENRDNRDNRDGGRPPFKKEGYRPHKGKPYTPRPNRDAA